MAAFFSGRATRLDDKKRQVYRSARLAQEEQDIKQFLVSPGEHEISFECDQNTHTKYGELSPQASSFWMKRERKELLLVNSLYPLPTRIINSNYKL